MNQPKIIMNDKVNLLVYLSPVATFGLPAELVLHTTLNNIAPIANMKLIESEPTVKAFVQVNSVQSAHKLITQLSGCVLPEGKLKIVISKHRDVVYPVRLSELLRRCAVAQQDRTRTTGTDLSRTDSAQEDELKRGLKTAEQIAFFKGKTEESTPNGVEEHIVRVTHSDPESLKGGRVLRIFRRFGRIVQLLFDYERVCWSVEYRSSKEVIKIAAAISNGTLYGYELAEEPTVLTIDQPQSVGTHLQLIFADPRITLEKASLLVAKAQIPEFVYEAIDNRSNSPIFIAQFKNSRQAVNVLQELCNTEGVRVTVCPFTLA